MALTLVEKSAPGHPMRFLGQPVGSAGGRIPVMKVFEITFDSSYLTGGELIAVADVGMATIDNMVIHDGGGRAFKYNSAAGTIIAYQTNGAAPAALAEVASATNLSSVSVRALIFGTEAA